MENKFPNNEPEAQKNEDNEQPMQQLNASTINGAKDYIADGGLKISFNCNNMYADASFVEAFKKWLDGKKKGAHEEVVNVAKGEKKEDATAVLPPELKTPKAMVIWKALQEHYIIGPGYMPSLSISDRWCAYIAQWMGKMLGINNFYVLLGRLWNIDPQDMKSMSYKAKDTERLGALIELLNCIEKRVKATFKAF